MKETVEIDRINTELMNRCFLGKAKDNVFDARLVGLKKSING